MNNIQKRFLLFLIGCIGSRSFLVYLAKTLPNKYLNLMGYIALIISIGFTYIYFTKTRKTGAETFGDKIWWNDLRPIHAILYGLFAICAINNVRKSWMILLLDVLIGLFSFLKYHYSVGNFHKL